MPTSRRKKTLPVKQLRSNTSITVGPWKLQSCTGQGYILELHNEDLDEYTAITEDELHDLMELTKRI